MERLRKMDWLLAVTTLRSSYVSFVRNSMGMSLTIISVLVSISIREIPSLYVEWQMVI